MKNYLVTYSIDFGTLCRKGGFYRMQAENEQEARTKTERELFKKYPTAKWIKALEAEIDFGAYSDDLPF